MKRNHVDDSPTDTQSFKFTKNPNNERIERKLTFQLNESYKNDLPGTPSDFKMKTHQSTPYPKLKIKQLKEEENEDSINMKGQTTPSTEVISEKRNPEFLRKLASLNRTFIRWIDIYFNKGYDEGNNYDFTPVCNDYIKFINNLKEKYPIENSRSKLDNSSLNNEKSRTNCLNESSTNSPIKNKFNLFSSVQFTNTPPPNPGDKDYKSTPFPKVLLNKNIQQTANESNKLKLITDNKSTVTSNFELPQQQIKSEDEKKKEIKFPEFSFSSTATVSTNEPFQFNNQLSTSNPISKNLFDIKPKSANDIFTPDKIGLEAKKPIDNNFFSPENMFKTQFNQSKPNDQSSFNLTVNVSNANLTTTQTNDDENYVPPKPEVCQIDEDAVHTIKCKLFFKKDAQYVEKGIGTLYIKETNEEAGNQLLIRADNSLGTILLNIRLKKDLPIASTKTGLLLTCIPNPPLDDKKNEEGSKQAAFYIKVKTNEIRDELLNIIKQYSI